MGADSSGPEVIVNPLGSWSVPEALLKEGCKATLRRDRVFEAEISLTLVDDDAIRRLNQEYFRRDAPTDVIAFALHDPGEPILGDVYVGYDQAVSQAAELGVSLEEELLRLVVHGTLHLLGYEHPEGEERSRSEMFRIQEEIVDRLRPGPGS
jgi:probable rRNA maturation factor